MNEIKKLENSVEKFKKNMNDIDGIRNELVVISNEAKTYNKNILEIEKMLNQDIKSSSEFLNDKINSNQLELKKDIKTFYDSINKEFDLKHKEISS